MFEIYDAYSIHLRVAIERYNIKHITFKTDILRRTKFARGKQLNHQHFTLAWRSFFEINRNIGHVFFT